jgi:bifunctional ADP-heptose synthase (sugar kinase/adenylyltransferase)
MKILVLGESCQDIFHYGECKRLCPAAPVPVFNSIHMIKNGGMAKNVEKNLQSLDIKVDLITNKNWQQITKTRFVEYNSNHMFLRVDEQDSGYGTLCLKEIEKIDFSQYDSVIVSDYNKGFLSEEVLVKISQSHPLTFLDTKKRLTGWCKDFIFIKVNNAEYEASKNIMSESTLTKVIRTKGPHGCVFQNVLYPVKSVEVKDTSGAGDTFISALAAKYTQTKDISEAIKYANECATIVVQKKGVNTI